MKLLILLIVSALTFSTGFAAEKDTRCFEMRTYYAAPGKLDDLLARFRDHTVKLFEKHGMVNIGYWVPLTNTENKLVYIMAYPSREAREKSWKEFSSDPDWNTARKASEANGNLVKKADSVFLAATDFSALVQPSQSKESCVFELRTYHATPGKLDDLLARFRDHTKELFAKHGMGQFGYWVPTETKDGSTDTLIYILQHKSPEAAKASFKAFAADPEWTKAKTASEANGPLTIKDGVKSEFMTATDFSPTK
ncbi:MAG: family containing protein [Pedosphaera sp.]|nr:family containing protein [Pedosphaera sp.]